MGETILDADSQKEYTELCKILKFRVNQANIYHEMYGLPDLFLSGFNSFNIGPIKTTLEDFVNLGFIFLVSCCFSQNKRTPVSIDLK